MPQGPDEPIHALREAAIGPSGALLMGARAGGSRPLALKVLRRSSRRDAEHVAALVDQSRRLGEVGHQAIVSSREIAKVGPWIAVVSPWIAGVDLLELSEIWRERGLRLPTRVACDVIHPVAAALDAALNRPAPGQSPLGVQHRDLKPSNVLIDRDGGVRVLDFGLGFTSLAGRNAVKGALRAGIVKYLSPARRLGQRGGPPADVYALGVMAIELFRGRSLLRLHRDNPAHDRYLAELVARLEFSGPLLTQDEQALRSVLLRMVGHDPEGRPPAAEVAAIFTRLVHRGTGPELEAYAWEHVRPLIPEVPATPDAQVAGITATTVTDLDVFPDAPFTEVEPEEADDPDDPDLRETGDAGKAEDDR